MAKLPSLPRNLLKLVLAAAYIFGMAIFSGAAIGAESTESRIARVEQMPKFPQPLSIRDWGQVTRDYLNAVFDFDRQGDHLPLVAWLDDERKMVSLPSYIGGPRDPEAINFLAAVISGSHVGMDMRDFRGIDWVAMSTNFFNAEEGVYVNRLTQGTGPSFWYDLLPNVLFYQVAYLYPDEPQTHQRMKSVAQQWHDACVALGGRTNPPQLPDFNHTGMSLKTMQPIEKGWIEPESAAGIAWLEYMAWRQYEEPQFLTAAEWALQSLEERPDEQSPLYEVLLPYGALAAARMNAELGRSYDVAKLVNACFEPRGRLQARPGWGVISDRWNGMDAHGLVGSTTDGDGYAFAMNTFQWAGALTPIARYDVSYARDIGRWMLNLVNASRLFYPNVYAPEHQSSHAWSAAYDPKSAVAYEGIRKWKRGSTTACADYSTTGGRAVEGDFTATHFVRETANGQQVFEEANIDGEPFQHIWEFRLPDVSRRWLVVAAERFEGGHAGNEFHFSFAAAPDGPYTPAFSVSGSAPPQVVPLPTDLRGRLYVKVASSERGPNQAGSDRLVVDAISITYQQTDIGPFVQGDSVVTFVALLEDATVPIVLYRPESACTDFGLYGSSHVGILGGIVRQTNVPGILQLDLLKTDYFRDDAYPTFLYYNPHDREQSIELLVGAESCDIYDAASDAILARNVVGSTSFVIAADSARVLVVVPAGGTMRREGRRTLINDVVVRY